MMIYIDHLDLSRSIIWTLGPGDAALRPGRTCFNPTHALVVTAAETLVRCRWLKHVETC